jgi:hypothetical protein
MPRILPPRRERKSRQWMEVKREEYMPGTYKTIELVDTSPMDYLDTRSLARRSAEECSF